MFKVAALPYHCGSSFWRCGSNQCVLKHYEGYIAALSTRKLYDQCGNPHYCVDETLRRRLETKLITKILAFEVA